NWLRPRLGPESRVGVWLPSGVGSALTNFALAFLGKASVNLNYTAGVDPVLSAVRQAEITTVITSTRFVHRMPLELPDDIRRISLEDALGDISGRERFVKFLAVLLLPAFALDRLMGLRSKLDDVLT